VVAKIVLYFIATCIVFGGIKSFTDNWMPADASATVAAFFALIVFVGLFVITFIFGRKKKEKK